MADLLMTLIRPNGSEASALVSPESWEITKELALESGGTVTQEPKEAGYYTVATILSDEVGTFTYRVYTHTGN